MDLLSIDSLSDKQIAEILGRAQLLVEENRSATKPVRTLDGRILFNVFYESSTRTAMSFATAAHRLGASALALSVEHSSVKKGETLEDTAKTLNAMRPDALVIRHRENGVPARVAEIMEAPVINAGDGTNEHPDAGPARRRDHSSPPRQDRGRESRDLRRHPPQPRCALERPAAPAPGADLRLAGPPDLMPKDIPQISIGEAIEGADVVMMLRVQRERLEEDLGDGPGEYLARYGLTADRLATAAPDAVIMHPARSIAASRSKARSPTTRSGR